MTLKVGGLFAGYGGIELALSSVLDCEPAWLSEFEAAPSKILAHRWPNVPNLGDVTKIDWHAVEPVDIITGGYPCQPFSHAGRREGTSDDRHLWPYVADAIAILRPSLCVFENVRGHLSLGYDQVLRDLHQLGYDARWYLLRAADVGAAHGRARLFIFGSDRRNESGVRRWTDRRGGLHRHTGVGRHLPRPAQGVDVGQGAPGAGLPGDDVRREGQCRPGSHRGAARVVHLGADGREGVRPDRGTPPSPVGEGPGCGCGAGVRPAAQVVGALAAARQAMDARGAGAGRDAAGADSGGEPTRAGPRASEPTVGYADSGLPLGLVVGAGGVATGAGRVHGPASAVRGDDLRSRLLDPEVAGAVDVPLPPTPAVNDMGKSYIEALRLLPTPTTSEGNGSGGHGTGALDLRTTVSQLLPTPQAADGNGGGRYGSPGHAMPLPGAVIQCDWREYEAAIRRQEHAFGRPAPLPTEPGKTGKPRLSPRFVEWLMGLPDGWVTDVPGITRNDQLKALGNGVCPPQAAAATRAFLHDISKEEAAA